MARIQLTSAPSSLTDEQIARLPVAIREVLLGQADWATIANPHLPRPVVNEAATRLAQDPRFLSCRFKAPGVDRRVREASRAVGRAALQAYLRSHVFPEALLLAAADAREKRRIRISRDWAKTARGHVTRAIPAKHLTLSLFRAWLRQESKRRAGELIGDGALDHLEARGPHRSSRAATPAEWDPWAKDLLPLLDASAVRAGLDAMPAARWRRLRVRLSPRERELADLLRRRASRAEAADAMRIHVSTVKALYNRIAKKARALA